MARRWSASLIVLLCFFAACAGGDDPALESPSATEGGQAAEDAPAVTITSPENDASVKAGDITIKVAVQNFEVVDKMGDDAAEGEGHLHYYFDIDRLPTNPKRRAGVRDEDAYEATTEMSYTWNDVEPGVHNFAVQLVNNDHKPLDPPVTARTTVSVKK